VDKGRLMAFFKKKTLCEKGWAIAQSKQKLAKHNDRVANRTLISKDYIT
jgi:hypothetical protein